jgi:hypothetical protein
LFIKIAQDTIVTVVSRPSNSQNIGVFRVPDIKDAKPLHIIDRSEASQELNITAITATAVKVKQPWRFYP